MINIGKAERVIIENVKPQIDGGRYAVKRECGDTVCVTADIFMDGHDDFAVTVYYRKKGVKAWKKTPMEFFDNDTWKGSFVVEEIGFYEYTIKAYPLIDKKIVSSYHTLEVMVERKEARVASWYGMWPRSQGKIKGESATFADMTDRLDDIKWMGFDVVYLTPVHPIGKSFKKGPNNSLTASETDPGCPYSIGNEHGGHMAVEPTLGTMEQFEDFVAECGKRNMEVALDIALNCSYDHPYLKDHPEWFFRREDGTIKYAENPPKKYEDVYPLDFFTKEKREELWEEIERVFLFWLEKGVKMFRVDNPHTKSIAFWEWLIARVKVKHPDAIFLAEAFTRPKVMKSLAKIGYSQSYTYFTWRNHKKEIIEYVEELTSSEASEYMRGNFFTCTPDILPEILQMGGRPAFKMRYVLAATLSSLCGIYNGFELIENRAIPGKEEYLNSEKYEFKVWDWNRPGNIKPFIAKVNEIKNTNDALQHYKNIKFYKALNDKILFYAKFSPVSDNAIFVVANLDPFAKHSSLIYMPIKELGIGEGEYYQVRDLITGQLFTFQGAENYIELDPNVEPAHILRVERKEHHEQEFPLF